MCTAAYSYIAELQQDVKRLRQANNGYGKVTTQLATERDSLRISLSEANDTIKKLKMVNAVLRGDESVCTCTHHIPGQHYDNCAISRVRHGDDDE